jgi:septin 7
MHFATMVHHHATRARTKSVQFGKSVMSLDSADTASSRDDAATSPPTPGTRTTSLPLSNKKENVNPIRHYRSLLDLEDAPRLPHFMPLCYDELYPKPTESMAVHKAPLLRLPLHC